MPPQLPRPAARVRRAPVATITLWSQSFSTGERAVNLLSQHGLPNHLEAHRHDVALAAIAVFGATPCTYSVGPRRSIPTARLLGVHPHLEAHKERAQHDRHGEDHGEEHQGRAGVAEVGEVHSRAECE